MQWYWKWDFGEAMNYLVSVEYSWVYFPYRNDLRELSHPLLAI